MKQHDSNKPLELTGPWAGFSFRGGCLITPEGKAVEAHSMRWLSLTAAIAQEWQRMRQEAREGRTGSSGNIIALRDEIRRRSCQGAVSNGDGRDGAGPASVGQLFAERIHRMRE